MMMMPTNPRDVCVCVCVWYRCSTQRRCKLLDDEEHRCSDDVRIPHRSAAAAAASSSSSSSASSLTVAVSVHRPASPAARLLYQPPAGRRCRSATLPPRPAGSSPRHVRRRRRRRRTGSVGRCADNVAPRRCSVDRHRQHGRAQRLPPHDVRPALRS